MSYHSPSNATATRRPDVELVPDADGERLIAIDAASGRQVRMSPLAGRLLGMLDGQRSSTELAEALGLADPSLVDQAITHFDQLALTVEQTAPLQCETSGAGDLSRAGRQRPAVSARPAATYRGAGGRAPSGRRRWRYRRPATLELMLVDPQGLLRSLRRVGDLLATRAGQAVLWSVTLAGTVVLLLTTGPVGHDLSRPAPWWVAIGALAAVLAATAVHELAHGIALLRAGGRVRRMGVMLLYGSPALFCDVSDAWRLPRRRRVTVALAGARVHAAVAAALILAAAMMPAGSVRQLLTIAAAGNAVAAVVNLYPFVKFDGYIALVGWLDRPHLRAHSMRAAQDVLLSRLVFGARAPFPSRQTADQRPLAGRWVLFGVVSVISGPALVALAFLTYEPLLLTALGKAGAVLALALLIAAGTYPVVGLLAAARRAAAAGAPRWRRMTGAAVLSCAVAFVLSGPRVQLSVPTVYQRTGTDVVVVVPNPTGFAPGAEVTLQRAGVVLHSRIAKGQVCGSARPALIDANAGSPISQPSNIPVRSVRRQVAPICAVRAGQDLARADPTGLASVASGTVPIGSWLERTFVEPAIARLR
jgi:putative peptide zinc metalloprotease protein